MAFNRERGEEQLTTRIGMLARRVIVGKLHANFVADALAPEIPVEVIVGHAKLPKHTKKWPRGAAKVPEQWTLPRSECRVLESGTLPVLLDHATLLLLHAEMAGRAPANAATPGQLRGRAVEVCCATGFLAPA